MTPAWTRFVRRLMTHKRIIMSENQPHYSVVLFQSEYFWASRSQSECCSIRLEVEQGTTRARRPRLRFKLGLTKLWAQDSTSLNCRNFSKGPKLVNFSFIRNELRVEKGWRGLFIGPGFFWLVPSLVSPFRKWEASARKHNTVVISGRGG